MLRMGVTEWIVLGLVQGLTEWLPISSEGMTVLVMMNFFRTDLTLEQQVMVSLFLHLGTFLAALIYFRRDVVVMVKTLISYKRSPRPDQKTFVFLVVTTCVSGALGFLLFKTTKQFESLLSSSASVANAAIGALLLVTGCLQLKAGKGGVKTEEQLSQTDNMLLGFAQGVAVLPGLSRSGLTVSALLLRGFRDSVCLRLSFLMSLPIVLAGNVILNLLAVSDTAAVQFSPHCLAGLAVSFIVGIASISILMRLCSKFNFGMMLLVFGPLLIVSAFIG